MANKFKYSRNACGSHSIFGVPCYWRGVFLPARNEGGKHVSAQDELPTGSLRHLESASGPRRDVSSDDSGGMEHSWPKWTADQGGVWMCARLRMFSQLLNRPLSLSFHLAVPSPCISLFLLRRFFQISGTHVRAC